MAIFKSTRRRAIARDLARIRATYVKLAKRLLDVEGRYRQLIGFEGHTGFDSRRQMGHGSTENTPFAVDQLLIVLSLIQHPELERFIRDIPERDFGLDPSSGPELDRRALVVERLELLVRAAILEGVKILDGGCGRMPTFARVCRALGADTYTIDTEGSDKFLFGDVFDGDARELEVVKHIQVNLRDEDAFRRILDASGGNFDLVTDAHLNTDPPGAPDDFVQLAMSRLLVPSGIVHSAPSYLDIEDQTDDKIKIKHGEGYLKYHVLGTADDAPNKVEFVIAERDQGPVKDILQLKEVTKDRVKFTYSKGTEEEEFEMRVGESGTLEGRNGIVHEIYAHKIDSEKGVVEILTSHIHTTKKEPLRVGKL